MRSVVGAPLVVAITAAAALIAGCGSDATAPAATTIPAATDSSSSSVGSTALGSSGSTSSKNVAPAAASFNKGQRVDPNALVKITKAAVIKAGGTYSGSVSTAGGTITSQVKYVGDRVETSSKGMVSGKKISVILINGVTYLGGLGIGPKPYLKVTPRSTGELARVLKPLTNIANGGSLPTSATWTVVSSSADSTALKATHGTGVTVVTNWTLVISPSPRSPLPQVSP